MWNKLMLLGATSLLLVACGDQSVAESIGQKKEKAEVATKKEEKVLPELRVIGENATGAGLIIKQEGNELYMITNGALVATNPNVLIQFSNKDMKQATVHYMSTAHNIAILKVNYKTKVNVPDVFTEDIANLEVYVNGDPYTVQQYEDKIDAFYVKADEEPRIGSPVMEAENGDVVGIYLNRIKQGINEPYILPLKDIVPFMDEWIAKGMKPKDRLEQSRNLLPYAVAGNKDAVKKAIETFGEDVFAYNADEVEIFLDQFHQQLKLAVQFGDSVHVKEIVGAEDLQKKMNGMVAYYTSKNAKIRFLPTKVKNIELSKDNLVVRTKTNYILTNQAGKEAKASSDSIYEIFRDDEGIYKMIRLTME
ncbi:MAG: hypothetical protein RR595_11490 [Lysinibacillus sp.]